MAGVSKNSNDRSLENDVIYYVKKNMSRAPMHIVIKECEGRFPERVIADAKTSLLAKFGEDLTKIDSGIAKSVEHDRRDSHSRSRATAIIRDIVSILHAFDGTECDINVSATSPESVPQINPEFLKPACIVARLEQAEAFIKELFDKITQLQNDNSKLNKDLSKCIPLPNSPPLPSAPPPPPPDAQPSAPPLDGDDATPGPTPAVSLPPRALKGKEKHERNIASTTAAATAAAQAIVDGKSPVEAISAGTNAATMVAKSYAAAAAATGGGTGNAGFGRHQNSYGNSHGANNKKRARLSEVAPYRAGTAVATGTSIAAKKPDHINNKCMVIAGINKDVSRSEFLSYVNDIAEKEITFKRIENLNRTDSWWRTIAVELSDEDYNILNKPEIWENGISLREYRGWRFWHGPKRRSTHNSNNPNTARNAVRESWSTSTA